MKFFTIICIVALFSCRQKSPHEALIKDVSEVRTLWLSDHDTISKVYTDLGDIELFKELIDGRRDTLEPGTNPTIVTFLNAGTSVLPATVLGPGCMYVVEGDTFKTRFRYPIGIFWIR